MHGGGWGIDGVLRVGSGRWDGVAGCVVRD